MLVFTRKIIKEVDQIHSTRHVIVIRYFIQHPKNAFIALQLFLYHEIEKGMISLRNIFSITFSQNIGRGTNY